MSAKVTELFKDGAQDVEFTEVGSEAIREENNKRITEKVLSSTQGSVEEEIAKAHGAYDFMNEVRTIIVTGHPLTNEIKSIVEKYNAIEDKMSEEQIEDVDILTHHQEASMLCDSTINLVLDYTYQTITHMFLAQAGEEAAMENASTMTKKVFDELRQAVAVMFENPEYKELFRAHVADEKDPLLLEKSAIFNLICAQSAIRTRIANNVNRAYFEQNKDEILSELGIKEGEY